MKWISEGLREVQRISPSYLQPPADEGRLRSFLLGFRMTCHCALHARFALEASQRGMYVL